MSQAMALSFNDVQFDIVDQDGQPWLQGFQVGAALGYKHPESAISNIFNRNKDEFTDKMTRTVKLTVGNDPLPQIEGGAKTREVRIFSLRGAHLIAMFARTKVAKDFRKWVLDVLDRYVNGSAEPKTINLTPSTANDRQPLKNLVNTWCRLAGLKHSEAWTQVDAAFNLNKIEELPKEWIPDACAWVQSRIDQIKKELPQPNSLATKDPMFYDKIMGDIYRTGLQFCGDIQDEAQKALGDFKKFVVNRPSDLDLFYHAHHRQILEGTEFLMRGVNMIMRSVESIKYMERMNIKR